VHEPDCRAELSRAIDQGFRVKRELLLTDPDLASVHAEKWFKELAESIPT
jgi:hypothetical protein